jgi:hypothetical protein
MVEEFMIDFSKQFTDTSVIWLFISGLFGALFSKPIELLFTHIFPTKYIESRKNKNFFNCVINPLIRSADSFNSSLDLIIKFAHKKWFDDPCDDYFRITLLYKFGAFFAYCKLMEDSCWTEFIDSNGKAIKLNIALNRIYKSLTGYYYIDREFFTDQKENEITTIPKMALVAVCELMIIDSKNGNGLSKDIIAFTTFCKKYKSDEDYKKWFSYVVNLFSGFEISKSKPQSNRIITLSVNLKIFINLLNNRKRLTNYKEVGFIEKLNNKVQKIIIEENHLTTTST